MFYPTEVIEDVRVGNDIISVISGYVALKQKGANFFGLCPFHKEKSPSFSVNADKQLYYCFGCGAGGNVLSFIMQMENLNFVDALHSLADRIHYALPDAPGGEDVARQAHLKEVLTGMHAKAGRYFYDRLQSPEGQAAAAYLEQRRVSAKTLVKFGLGYAPGKRGLSAFLAKEGYSADVLEQSGLVISDKRGGFFDRFSDRLMFPIIDVRGKVVGFGGRILDSGDPKYLNSPDTSIFDKGRTLYGLQFAKKVKTKEFILVEGYMDVIALFQAGFPQAVAALGTSFTAGHAKLLRKYCESVVVLFDSDEAGTKAALRAIPILLAAGLTVKVLQVTDAKDPDEYIKSFGSERFAQLLGSAQSHITFQVGQLQKQYRLENAGERVAFTSGAAALIAKADNAIERDVYCKEIAELTHISEDAISIEVRKIVDKNQGSMKNSIKDRKAIEYALQGKSKDKGGLEAKKGLIYFAAMHLGVRRALKAVLQPDELGDSVYVTLLQNIYTYPEHEKEIAPAQLVNLFENLEEQKIVSEIFNRTNEYESDSALEKAVNEMLRVVKKCNVDEKIPGAEWDQLKSLVELKRNIDLLYITISDG